MEGAADKATTQQEKVLPCQLPKSGMKRDHIPEQVTARAMRGVNGLAARYAFGGTAVGATWRSSEHRSLKGNE